MSEQTNAELIATAKAMREQMGEEPKPGSILALWFETAERLEAADQRAKEAESERDRAKSGAKTLGEIVERQIEDTLRWAGMEDQIGLDDPDQQTAWELCAEMPEKIARLTDERDALAAAAETSREPSEGEIEAFREAWKQADADGDAGNRVRRGLTAALRAAGKRAEEAERERDQYAVVVEKARDWAEEPGDADEIAFEDLNSILATAPADALREHDAALIEKLADDAAVEVEPDAPDDFLRGFDAGADAVYAFLREKARQRREEQS